MLASMLYKFNEFPLIYDKTPNASLLVLFYLIFCSKKQGYIENQGLYFLIQLLFQNIFFLDHRLANTNYQVGVEMHLILYV